MGIPDAERLQAEVDAYAEVGLFDGDAPDVEAFLHGAPIDGRLRRLRRGDLALPLSDAASVLAELAVEPFVRGAEVCEEAARRAVIDPGEGEQDVLAPDVVVPESQCLA